MGGRDIGDEAPTESRVIGTDEPVLSLKDVRRQFGSVMALDGISLNVLPGACVTLLGENGSGKTTTLLIAAGRLRPTSGSVAVAGRDLGDARQRRSARAATAFAGDVPSFYRDLTAREHAELVALAHGRTAEEQAVDRLFERYDLDRRAHFVPDQLSAGMRQRLQLICCFVRPFSLLLLDEPDRALDSWSRGVLWEHLTELKAEGVAIVFVTHHLDVPRGLVDATVVLEEGRVVWSGALEELADHASTVPAVARVLGEVRGGG